jgi:hypothetical protein
MSFGTVYILVRQALAAREMTSPSQVSVLQRKAEAKKTPIGRRPLIHDSAPDSLRTVVSKTRLPIRSLC